MEKEELLQGYATSPAMVGNQTNKVSIHAKLEVGLGISVEQRYDYALWRFLFQAQCGTCILGLLCTDIVQY